MYLARDPSPLSSNRSSPQMEQPAPSTALHRRKSTHNPSSHRCHTEPPRHANPSEILARSPRLATIPLDPSVPRSRVPQLQNRLSNPTPSRRNLHPRAEHILPLVRRSTELPRREVRSGGVCGCAGMPATRSSCGDRSRA